ncbi:hypothetical protein MY3296_006168 [Beauveria thailandica]
MPKTPEMENCASRHLDNEAAAVADGSLEPTNPLSDNERRRVYRARTRRDVDEKVPQGDSSAETTAKISSSIIARHQAKLASAFETDTPDLTKPLVVAGYERHRVVDAVKHASEVQLPAARLIFVCPVSIGRASATAQFSTSVRLRGFCGRSIVAALQRTEDVDFHFRVPYLSEADSSKEDPEILEGRIFYNPSSDDCVLKNLSDLIYASRYDRTYRHRLQTGSAAILEPGLWRIWSLIPGITGMKSIQLVDVLILPRRFCVVRTARTTDHAKRAYSDQPETDGLHKKPKTMHPAAQPMLEQPVASSSMTPVLERVAAAPVSIPATLNNHGMRVDQAQTVGILTDLSDIIHVLGFAWNEAFYRSTWIISKSPTNIPLKASDYWPFLILRALEKQNGACLRGGDSQYMPI